MEIYSSLLANAYGALFPTVHVVSTVCRNGGGEVVSCPNIFLIILAAFTPFLLMGVCLLAIISVVAMWRIFEKAGQPGWAALVPFYNLVILLKIIKKPLWWIVLLFVPYVNVVVAFVVTFHLARVFGRGFVFASGLFFLPIIFYPILGFGRARYVFSGDQK